MTRMKSFFALIASTALLLPLFRVSAAEQQQQHHQHQHHHQARVETTSGTILGHAAPNQTDTYEFLGIKYGKAPIGDLRFAAPVPYESDSTYNASSWNPDCPANIPPVTTFPNFTGNGFRVYNKFTAHLGNTQAEDCLALNVWTKSPKEDECEGKPVLVFFHGGRFTIPGPHSPFYNGKYLAGSEDVVVVTVSYRLGIFGFSGAPGIEQNVALLDQRLAVEWVRDNIAGFGGDQDRIIIFGQSVGGWAVDNYAYAWKDDPIVAGIISQSGTTFSFITNTPEYSQRLYYNVSGTLGCGSSSTDQATTLACIRSKNFTQILAAARLVPALPTQALSQATFHPTVDNKTVWADYLPLAQAGKFAKVPYLAGNGNYESGFYRVGAFAAKVNLSPEKWELFTQRGFSCPTKYANDFRDQFDVPTWRYRYMGDWENLRLYPAFDGYPDSGAYHGADMNMIFGTAYDVTGQVNSAEEEATSRYMRSAWAAFARDPENGLNDFGWPSWGADGATLVRLAYNNTSGPNFVDPAVYDSTCPPVEQNDPLPGRGGF